MTQVEEREGRHLNNTVLEMEIVGSPATASAGPGCSSVTFSGCCCFFFLSCSDQPSAGFTSRQGHFRADSVLRAVRCANHLSLYFF